VTDIYNCNTKQELIKHTVFQNDFGKFCVSLKRLESSLGENAEDPFWTAFLSPLKRYRFELCASPVPFNKPSEKCLTAVRETRRRLLLCKSIFPHFEELANDIVEQISSLLELNENPILDYLNSQITLGKTPDPAIVLKESYLVHITEESLNTNRELRKVTLLVPTQLKSCRCYKNLFLVGPSHWFPGYVFCAPRAPKIISVRYSWIADTFRVEPVFASSSDVKRASLKSAENDRLSPDEIVPAIDWGYISRRVTNYGQKDDLQEETIARLFLLEDGKAVLLDAEESSSALIIDLNEEDRHRVKRIATNNISPDIYVLLRTSGGGDFVVSVADRIMDKRAENARLMQKQWKTKLHEMAKSLSLLEISLKLLDLGALKANEVNLRNWMSYRSIRTAEYGDFDAIMQLVGLGSRVEELWEIMGMIDKAHRRAGHLIRKLLLQRVVESNLDELQRSGIMEFELSEVGGGSLTAFRVCHVSDDLVKVPVTLLGHPLDVKDALWH
jgi:hypothetical protein